MPPVVEALAPVFMVIACGWGVRAAGFVLPLHWEGFERVTYYVLIPALVLTTLATADLRDVPIFNVGAMLLLPTVAIGASLFLVRDTLRSRLGIGGPAFTSVLQGAVRWNSFVAVALAGAFYGKGGGALAAVAFAVLIPIANVMSAYALARHGEHSKPLEWTALVVALAKNPFIWSTFAGIGVAALGLPVPRTIAVFGDVVGRAALAAGLLLVGAGLDLANIRRPGAAMWVAIGLKLVAAPLLALAIGWSLGLAGPALAVPMICASVPTAAASYILARQNGGDAPLMASIITVQTIAAALTMPIMLMLAA